MSQTGPLSPSSEHGSVTFFVIGVFLVLLVLVGTTTDLGVVMRYRRAMQNACDAGVLAGAQDLGSTTRVATVTAQTYAERDLTENHIAWDGFQAQTQDANGNGSGINPVRLWARIHATVPLFFLKPVAPSMQVAVHCAAQRAPVLQTGLEPVGLDSAVFTARWAAQGRQPCALFGTSGNPNAFGATPCGDCLLTFLNGGGAGIGYCDVSAPGPGNTGALDLRSNPVCGGNNGAANWACVFENGTGTNAPYCATPSQNADQSAWLPCSVVNTKPGNMVGAWRNAVQQVCGTPDPVSNPQASKWVAIMPLMNSALWEGGISGRSAPVDIVGFAAFEFDCPYMQRNGYEPIVGTFVSVLDKQGVTGNPKGQDTGADTVILVQ